MQTAKKKSIDNENHIRDGHETLKPNTMNQTRSGDHTAAYIQTTLYYTSM